MKKLSILLLAILCMLMISCNKKDNANNPAVSVDRTEPNTSSPETTASPETSSPETTESPETTKPPVPATTIPEQAGDPVLLPITYSEVTDFKYHTYSFPYPIRYLFNQSGRYRFETRSQLVSFAESKEYLEKLDLEYWWGTQEPIPEKEQYEQQVTDAVSKLLDMYDEKFFEDTCLILTCKNVAWFEMIDQVLGAYKSEKGLEIDYNVYVPTYTEEVGVPMLHKLHLVGLVLEIPKKYLLDETNLRISVATYPRETLDTLKKYGVDSKEAAEIAENERIVRLLKGYIKYCSNLKNHREEVQIIDAFLEKYQK